MNLSKVIRCCLLSAVAGYFISGNIMAANEFSVAVLQADLDQNGKIINTSKNEKLYKSIGEAIDKNSRDENNQKLENNPMLSSDYRLFLKLLGPTKEDKIITGINDNNGYFLNDYDTSTEQGIKTLVIYGEGNSVVPISGFSGAFLNSAIALYDGFKTKIYNTTFKDFAGGLYVGEAPQLRDLFLQDVVIQDCGSEDSSAIRYNAPFFEYNVSQGKQIIFGVKASSVIESNGSVGGDIFVKSGKGALLCGGNNEKFLADSLEVKDGEFIISPLNGDDSAKLRVRSALVQAEGSLVLENGGAFIDVPVDLIPTLTSYGRVVVKGSDTKKFMEGANYGVFDLTESKAAKFGLDFRNLNLSSNNNTLKFALAGNSSNPQGQDKQGYISAIKVRGELVPPTLSDKGIIDVDFNGFAFTKSQEFVLVEASSASAALDINNFILNYDDKNYSAALKVTSGSSATSDVKLILAVTVPSTNEQVRFESFENARGGTVTLDEQDLVVTEDLINSGTMRVEGEGQSALVAPVGNTFQPKQFANEGTLQIYKGASLQTGALENKLGATVNAAGGLAVEGKFVNRGNANLGKVAQS